MPVPRPTRRPRRHAVAHAEVLQIDSGLWCRSCGRATGNRLVVALRFRGGDVRLMVRYRCFECNGAAVDAAGG